MGEDEGERDGDIRLLNPEKGLKFKRGGRSDFGNFEVVIELMSENLSEASMALYVDLSDSADTDRECIERKCSSVEKYDIADGACILQG